MNRLNLIPAVTEGLISGFCSDHLNVYLYSSRQQIGAAVAAAVSDEMRRLIKEQGRAAGIFSSAPSQSEFLNELVNSPDVSWTRVIGFHLDEFLGINEAAPQSSRRFLTDRLVMKVPMVEFHGLRGEAANPAAVCANYASLLESRRPDFAVLSIGENGRLGLIGSTACDLNDPVPVRVIELDEDCRRRQIQEGTFTVIDEVPLRAISMTIPTIMKCPALFIIGAGARDREAVVEILEGEIGTSHPASILRTHPNAHLFLDREAAASIAERAGERRET